MDKLLEILEELVPGEEFSGRTNLVTDGVLDSFTILSLISEISYEMGVDIPVGDVIPENFDSVDAILAVIEKHRK
ncbi:MAG: acyl carrier protein [Wujia sp.]